MNSSIGQPIDGSDSTENESQIQRLRGLVQRWARQNPHLTSRLEKVAPSANRTNYDFEDPSTNLLSAVFARLPRRLRICPPPSANPMGAIFGRTFGVRLLRPPQPYAD